MLSKQLHKAVLSLTALWNVESTRWIPQFPRTVTFLSRKPPHLRIRSISSSKRGTLAPQAPAMLMPTLWSGRRSSTDWHDGTSGVTMRGSEGVDSTSRSELFDAKSANERLLDGVRVSPLAYAGFVPVSMICIVKMRWVWLAHPFKVL